MKLLHAHAKNSLVHIANINAISILKLQKFTNFSSSKMLTRIATQEQKKS
jgi:hypothetical protein